MKKKIKISLILSLAIIFGCFSNVFAESNQNNKAKKIAEAKKSVRLLDGTNDSGFDQYTKLLMHMDDNSFKDECEHNVKINNVALNTNDKKIGTGSASFSGTNSYLSTEIDKNIDISSGNFTIDWWQYQTSKGLYDTSFCLDPVETAYKSQIYFSCGSAGAGFVCGNPSATNSWAVNIASNTQTTEKVWQHIAIVRYGNIFTLYIDGQNCGTSTYSGDLINAAGKLLNIGMFDTGWGDYFHGYIDEFRISNTARWTSNFTPPYANVSATGISLNKTTDSLILNDPTKGTDTLTAIVTPDNAINKTVKWTSSNSDIVTVDENTGVITAGSKAGIATITATTTDGTNLSKSCVVTVTEPTIITLDKTTYSINVGDTGKITASVTPAEQAVAWSSSDNSIATVDDNGNIKGVSAGTVVITATTADGKTVSCTVTVKDKETGKSKLTLYMNDKTIREFYLTQDEIDDFIDWYTSKIKGEVTIQPYYVFNVSVQGKSSTKKSYVWFIKIESFEVE